MNMQYKVYVQYMSSGKWRSLQAFRQKIMLLII